VTTCYFVSDLHGSAHRYRKMFERLLSEPPDALFMGGDLLPHGRNPEFVSEYLLPEFAKAKKALQDRYPEVFLIFGNDDGRWGEPAIIEGAMKALWHYIPNHKISWRNCPVCGYAYVPPTPFRLKDWDRFDVSQYVDPGCLSPMEGFYSVPVPDNQKRFATIQKDLDHLTAGEDLERAIFLFHTPPYQTSLDCISTRARAIDGVPMDLHAGSIAVKRLIEIRQPLVTLHGHIHESARVSGSWQQRIGRTCAFTAAHDGPELALVRFSPEHPETATRELL